MEMEFIIQRIEASNPYENFVDQINARIRDGYQPYGGIKIFEKNDGFSAFGIGIWFVQALVKKSGPVTVYSIDSADISKPNRMANKDHSWILQGDPYIMNNTGQIWQAFVRHEVDLLGLNQTHM